MSMSFEESLQEVCKKLLLSPEHRQSFTKDAEKIRNNLINQMKEKDNAFKNSFKGLSLTGSNLDRLKIDLPDEFDLHIKLEMPFPITPHEDTQRPGFVILKTPKGTNHDIVRHDRVSRYQFQLWLHNILNRVLDVENTMNVNGRIYSIKYQQLGRSAICGVAHTIVAKELGGSKREIWFDFVPVFEFTPSEWPLKTELIAKNISWFAVPFGKRLRTCKERSNKFAFMVCAPHWERVVLHDKQNLKNSLRLMKALRNKNEMGRLTSYMLKSIYLDQIGKQCEEFWKQPMGVILIAMLEELAKVLSRNVLPFFLHKGFNHLTTINTKTIQEYKVKLDSILMTLRILQQQPSVKFSEVEYLFI